MRCPCNACGLDLVVVDVTPGLEQHFGRFVSEHGDALLRYARLLFANPHDAEDALQTALVRVVGQWPVDAPSAYTRTALRNLAVDGARRRHLVAVPSADEPALAPAPDVADAFAAAQTLDAILGALPTRQRVTVVLRVIDGLSEAETAAAMSCAPGTVKSNLSRGLAALRLQLAKTGSPERTSR